MLQPYKLSRKSAACIYLGRARNQPGHMCLETTSRRIYVLPHARFIETEFPGLATTTPSTNIPPVIPSPEPPVPPPAAPYEHSFPEEAPAGVDHEATPTEHEAADDEGTIAERIARRRRATAAVVAPDLLANCNVPY
eukprot:6171849-Pleurochrysis_carterae.AAC.1